MKTKEQLLKEIKEDIEVFGNDKKVYAWFKHENGIGNILIDYSLELSGNCVDPETICNLLEILENK